MHTLVDNIYNINTFLQVKNFWLRAICQKAIFLSISFFREYLVFKYFHSKYVHKQTSTN